MFERLCRFDVRKGSAFPGNRHHYSHCEAMPRNVGAEPRRYFLLLDGKAEPFRTSSGEAGANDAESEIQHHF
jgi:hypothetical protein